MAEPDDAEWLAAQLDAIARYGGRITPRRHHHLTAAAARMRSQAVREQMAQALLNEALHAFSFEPLRRRKVLWLEHLDAYWAQVRADQAELAEGRG